LKKIAFFFILLVSLLMLPGIGWTKIRVCIIPFENLQPGSGLDISPERFTNVLLERIKNDPKFELYFGEPGSLSCKSEADVLLKGEYSMLENEVGLDLAYWIMVYKTQAEIVKRNLENTSIDSISQMIKRDLEDKLFCQVYITSVPLGAKIYLSDSLLGITPLNTRLFRGSYSFEAVPDEANYSRGTIQLDLNSDSVSYDIKFQPKAFNVRVKSNTEGDSIYFDDSYIGVTPEAGIEIYKRGDHTLVIKRTEKKKAKEQKKEKEQEGYVYPNKKVPFQGSHLFINAKHDVPANKHFQDLYPSYVGGEIGLATYSDIIMAAGSIFYAEPATSNSHPHFIDAAGNTQEVQKVWRFGVDFAFSFIIPFGHLNRDKYPVFPFGGIGYQVASLNVDVARDSWVGYEERTESDFKFIRVNSQNWYYQAGLVFGVLNFGWKKTFDAKYTDWEGYFGGFIIRLK
jgi:hypothetical protein